MKDAPGGCGPELGTLAVEGGDLARVGVGLPGGEKFRWILITEETATCGAPTRCWC